MKGFSQRSLDRVSESGDQNACDGCKWQDTCEEEHWTECQYERKNKSECRTCSKRGRLMCARCREIT